MLGITPLALQAKDRNRCLWRALHKQRYAQVPVICKTPTPSGCRLQAAGRMNAGFVGVKGEDALHITFDS